ncbi:MAG: hypothetical protein KBT19_03685 [Lachnospiraceae bacterium]|nr:hypothetical protein [Candidatus Colinaster equi]
MDTFIDKLAQKFTAGEMIKGNTAAEAKEIKQLRDQVENYENLLQEMKMVNLKNIESAQKLSQLVEDNALAVKCNEESKQDNDANKEYVEGLFDKTNDTIHKENVKVYRNVQAAVNEGLENNAKAIIEKQEETVKKQASFTKVMSVLIFVAVLADIALNVLRILGIL